MAEPTPVVFIVDDDASVRGALERLFRTEGLRVRTFATADEFLGAALPDAPGCLVLDLQLPGCSGLDVQQALAQRDPLLPVVFISGHGDIPTSVRAMKAGAVDFLPKLFDDDALRATVREAIRRHLETRERERERDEAREQIARLTAHERQVLEGVVRGMLNKQIAHALDIAEKTVKAHRGQVVEKLQAGSIADLVRRATLAGSCGAAPGVSLPGTKVPLTHCGASGRVKVGDRAAGVLNWVGSGSEG